MMKGLTPKCPYCGKFSELVFGADIYPHRDDLFDLKFYLCTPCDAYVGTHKGNGQPKGSLANAELRLARRKAHQSFDRLWKNKNLTRTGAYQLLARRMKIKMNECHIGKFRLDQCEQTLAIMKDFYL